MATNGIRKMFGVTMCVFCGFSVTLITSFFYIYCCVLLPCTLYTTTAAYFLHPVTSYIIVRLSNTICNKKEKNSSCTTIYLKERQFILKQNRRATNAIRYKTTVIFKLSTRLRREVMCQAFFQRIMIDFSIPIILQGWLIA